MRVILASGVEHEGCVYAHNPTEPSSCHLRMVQQKKFAGENSNGTPKREQANMSFQRKDASDARVASGNGNRMDGKTQNGEKDYTSGRRSAHPVITLTSPKATDPISGQTLRSRARG